MEWLAQKYPDTFDKLYRPRLMHWEALQKEGKRWYNDTLPMLCQTCQIPMFFTEPDDPTKICYRESDYHGMKYHFCSDGCKDIFDDEPEKYVQAWLPVNQIYQGHCFEPDANPAAPGFNPLAEVMRYYHMNVGHDGHDYEDSPDRRNWVRWTGKPSRGGAEAAAEKA
jgi:phenol hydroxylase P3 protein